MNRIMSPIKEILRENINEVSGYVSLGCNKDLLRWITKNTAPVFHEISKEKFPNINDFPGLEH